MITDFETEKAHLLNAGYEPYIDEFDKKVSEKYPCSVCKGRCEYEGFKREGSYRAYSVCSNCGHWTEF